MYIEVDFKINIIGTMYFHSLDDFSLSSPWIHIRDCDFKFRAWNLFRHVYSDGQHYGFGIFQFRNWHLFYIGDDGFIILSKQFNW